MDVAAGDACSMIELAFGRMVDRARSLGDRVAERPAVPGANSVSALVAHCVGVTEWWLAHVALGDPVVRDRDAEFESTASLAELEARVTGLIDRLPDLLARVDGAAAPSTARPPAFDAAWPWTPAGMLLHVVEELFQHAGHVDLTTDLLLAP